jgi:NitT/TauT family transport system permease protein
VTVATTPAALDAAPSPEEYQARHKKAASRHRWRIRALQVALVVVAGVVWELASGNLVPRITISSPSAILPQFGEWLADGTLAAAAWSTFSSAGLGILIGGCTGVLVGVLLGQSTTLAEIFEPFITALYTMPKHALVPLFIIWVGVGAQLGVLMASVVAFFLIFFNTFFGVRDVRPSLVNSVLIMGGSRLDVLRRVHAPSALIWVIAGLKLAVPQAIVGVVVAEMLAGDQGLGHLVTRNAGIFNTAGTFAALFALLIAGFAVDRLMNWVTKKPLEWKNAASRA